MSGTDKSIFKILNRVVPFTIINPELNLPYIVNFQIIEITETSIEI